MPKCIQIKRKHRRVCIGDLDTFIKIKTRDNELKNFKSKVNFATHSDVWALWETVRGVEIFDDTNTSEIATEKVIVEFDPDITKEFFVELDGKNFRILEVEDLERRKEWTLMMLTDRGIKTKAVNES